MSAARLDPEMGTTMEETPGLTSASAAASSSDEVTVPTWVCFKFSVTHSPLLDLLAAECAICLTSRGGRITNDITTYAPLGRPLPGGAGLSGTGVH